MLIINFLLTNIYFSGMLYTQEVNKKTKNEFHRRFERLSLAAELVFLLLILYSVIQTAITVYFMVAAPEASYSSGTGTQDWLTLVYSLIFVVIVVIVMVLVLLLLRSIRRGDTPFTRSNVRRLRGIGWLLVAFEILQRLLARLFWAVASGRVQDGETVSYYFYSNGGMILMVGLAVLGISLVFEYGVVLQQLDDETL